MRLRYLKFWANGWVSGVFSAAVARPMRKCAPWLLSLSNGGKFLNRSSFRSHMIANGELRVHPALFEDLGAIVEHYRSFGDSNPLHYFDIRAVPPLGDILGTSPIRILPGAVVAVALYDHLVRNAVQAGQMPHAMAFGFTTPSLCTNGCGYDLLTREIPGRPHGWVHVHPLQAVTGPDDVSWVVEDLYGTLGKLWREEGERSIAAGVVPMVGAISIQGDLPEELLPKRDGRIVDYDRGQLALRTVPYRVFARMIGPYFAFEP